MKGQVDVIRNNLEARFSWVPNEEGATWNIEGLRSLLAVSDIRVEVSDRDLEKALDFFEASSGPGESDVVARGIPPVKPRPLRVEPKPSEIPSDVAPLVETLLKEAPPAEGETDQGWVDAGASAGTVYPPVAARAGLELNRDPIAAPEPEETDYRIGENLEIRGNELIAAVSGILRIEDNGMDLIPCERHRWSLSGGTEKGGCFLDFAPGHADLPLPSVMDIISAAGRLGILPDQLVSEDTIRSMLAGAVADGEELKGRAVSRDTDGKIAIEIDPLETSAVLVLRRETGNGAPLILKGIAAAIRNSGLRGLDGDAVKAAIMGFWKSDASDARIMIKEGRVPERGPDRELEYLIPFLDEEDAFPVRERLEFEPDKAMGLPSLKEFSSVAVSKMALVTPEQEVARLGAARTGKAGKDIHGRELPGYPGNDPDIRVHEGLKWNGDVIIAEFEGMLDVGTTFDGSTHLRVRPHKDAVIQITVSEDGFKAFVSTRLPVGTGAPVDADRIRDAAEKAGVVKGLLDEAIDEFVEKSLTGEIITGGLIAEGRLPMEGNTRLSLSVSGDPASAPVPVKAGDVIGTVKEGEDAGWNVLGEAIMESGGSLKEGDCIIRREEEGITTLVAEKGGHLVMEEGRLFVKDLLDYVGDVSLASGNIRFPGRIRIDGSVLSRVVVDGGEGVEVSHVVQAALVNSGGDVRIGKGIKGEGRAVIRSQGDLILGYAEDANLLTTGGIRVAKALMNCRVKCNGRLEITGRGGRLIGGVMKLKDGLVCDEVGNERGVETVVSFGQDYLVENQIEQVQNEIKKLQDYINKTDAMMADLEKKQDSGNRLIMVRQKKVDALKMLDKKNMRIFLLREKFERHFESEVKVTGTAHPGVTFESHGRLIKLQEPMQSFRILFDPEKGRLEKKPI